MRIICILYIVVHVIEFILDYVSLHNFYKHIKLIRLIDFLSSTNNHNINNKMDIRSVIDKILIKLYCFIIILL